MGSGRMFDKLPTDFETWGFKPTLMKLLNASKKIDKNSEFTVKEANQIIDYICWLEDTVTRLESLARRRQKAIDKLKVGKSPYE